MNRKMSSAMRSRIRTAAIFAAINLSVIGIIGRLEYTYVNNSLIRQNPDPDVILAELKDMDPKLQDIEGSTYDGLYMYYKGRYLYSWDTPYSVYENSGYTATERPWYQDAAAGSGRVVFTPPYMSYANHYILTTLSQMQPDGETVFACDIKMGDIQTLATSADTYENGQTMIFDSSGTIIGSTDSRYLGGNLYASVADAAGAFSNAEIQLDHGLSKLLTSNAPALLIRVNSTPYFACLLSGKNFSFLVLVPFLSALKGTLGVWLVPLLLVELLLIYLYGRIGKEQKNRELREAYIELGQTQKRLEIALSAAQKAAAVDDLTGLMNFRSFKKEVARTLDEMGEDESGILIMIDGDHFKQINDTYGHITLSSGAVTAHRKDNYTALSNTADTALYRAKETHDGKFAFQPLG